MRTAGWASNILIVVGVLVGVSLWPGCSDNEADSNSGSGAKIPEVGFGDVSGGGESDAGSESLDVAQSQADVLQNEQDVAQVIDGGGSSGFQYECEPLTVESCVTACGSKGHRKCLKEWGGCQPPKESCDNCVDDDCDGLINEDCPPNPNCIPPEKECPVAMIAVAEGKVVGTQTVLHLSAASSYGQNKAKIVKWAWSVQGPVGAVGVFVPSAAVQDPTFKTDAAGSYLFELSVWDDAGIKSCVAAVYDVVAEPAPPVKPSVGCADGQREGFLDQKAYPQIAACAGAWDQPGVTPDSVKPTCNNLGGDDGAKADGKGCSSADLCAVGWHVCKGWQEVAQKSPTGCANATPAGAKPKSLFFAIRQPSENGSVCGKWGDGTNDIFGCGNLGTTLPPNKKCGPLDRVIASTQPNKCGFNEAEPNLGPWECVGPGKSDLHEGENVTKKACQAKSCQYDGVPLGPSDKGGVVCCHGPKP